MANKRRTREARRVGAGRKGVKNGVGPLPVLGRRWYAFPSRLDRVWVGVRMDACDAPGAPGTWGRARRRHHLLGGCRVCGRWT